MKRANYLAVLAGLLLAGLLAAACAEPDGDDSGPAQGAATTVPTTLPGDPPVTKPAKPVGEVVLSGPGSADGQLVESLETHLGIPVQVPA